jgi:hypothetical protein
MNRFVLLAMIVGCATTDTDPPIDDTPADPVPDDPADPTPTDPPPPTDPLRVLTDWQACMQRTDYDAAGMAAAWSGHGTSSGLACQGCHGTGGHGFVASADAAFGFAAIKTEMFQLMSYVTVDAGRVVPNLPLLTGVGAGQITPEHPGYDTAAGNRAFSALRDFYDRTEARRLAGECGPIAQL